AGHTAFASFGGAHLSENTPLEIGSITKTFTAALLAVMVQRGEVALDDPIEKFLPAGAKAPTYQGRHITLRDLATQSSGLPRMPTNFTPGNADDPYADYGEKQLLEFLASYELKRAPGAEAEYSNLGFGLLGYLLARRLGMDYATAVRTRILEPLGMSHTHVGYTDALARAVAPGHDADGTRVPIWHDNVFAGAGAIVSTAKDMLRYAAANLGDVKGPLGAALADARRPRRALDLLHRVGLAWITTNADGIVWHNGGTGGYRSFLGLDEAHKRAIVVLANAVIDGVDALGMHALDPSVPLPPGIPADAAVDPATLAGYVGSYRFSDNSTCQVSRDNRGLVAFFQPPGLRTRLHATSATRFTTRSFGVVVTFAGSGDATTMTVVQRGGPPDVGRRYNPKT
ncbi:MAG: serine hydrolase, partial [Candidatus Eremiobacteraeota bacterium]|nr:serine hydrolase [Candidatus Eremiobacteraeota bacterium]